MPNWRALFCLPPTSNLVPHPLSPTLEIQSSADTPKTNRVSAPAPPTKEVNPQQPSPRRRRSRAQVASDKVPTSVANGLKIASGLLKEAVAGIRVPRLEAAIGVVVKVIDIIENVRDNDRDLSTLSRRISSLADAVGKSTKLHPKEDVSEELRLRMEAFLYELQALLDKLS